MENETTIKNKIHMENESRRILNLILPELKNKFNNFQNQEVIKKNDRCDLFKKVEEEIKPILDKYRNIEIKPLKDGDNAKISGIYIQTSEYNLYLSLKLCFSGGSYENNTYYCIYYDKNPYLCELKNRVLIRFYDREESDNKPLNAEELINIFRLAKEKQKEYEDLRDKLFYSIREML